MSAEDLQHQIDILRGEKEQLIQERDMLQKTFGVTPTPTISPALDTERFGDGQLTRVDVERYSRHMLLPQIGSNGVRRLRDAKVVVIGAGGLGSPVCLYLAAAGVGYLRIVDPDRVELSNLHRQIIHTTGRCGLPKVRSAQCAIQSLNPDVCVEAVVQTVNFDTVDALVEDMDVVIDATDNVPSRYIIGDAAAIHRKPLVWAAALRWEAQLSVFWSPQGPCHRCVFPVPPPADHHASCNDAGVCGMVPGIVGVAQALEALKIIVGCGTPLIEKMLLFDALAGEWRTIRLRGRNKMCHACGGAHTSLANAARSSTRAYESIREFPLCPPTPPAGAWDVAPAVLAGETAPYVIVDVRPKAQFGIFALPHSLNLPWTELRRAVETGSAGSALDRLVAEIHERKPPPQVAFVVCRRGVASVQVVPLLRGVLAIHVYNVAGGLDALRGVMPQIPFY